MIFCEDCKYCKFDVDASYAGSYICVHKNSIIDKHDYHHKWVEYRFCEHKNCENSCTDFYKKLSVLEKICQIFHG